MPGECFLVQDYPFPLLWQTSYLFGIRYLEGDFCAFLFDSSLWIITLYFLWSYFVLGISYSWRLRLLYNYKVRFSDVSSLNSGVSQRILTSPLQIFEPPNVFWYLPFLLKLILNLYEILSLAAIKKTLTQLERVVLQIKHHKIRQK